MIVIIIYSTNEKIKKYQYLIQKYDRKFKKYYNFDDHFELLKFIKKNVTNTNALVKSVIYMINLN